MGVTIELQNLGDAHLSKEISARIEHALSEKQGEWRVVISGSRESEDWDMRMEAQTASSGPTVLRVHLVNMNLTRSVSWW